MNTYLLFKNHIQTSEIKNIFECGARHCEDSIGIHNDYKGTVYAFEADPRLVNENLKNKTELENNGVIIFDKPIALYSYTGKIKFGSIDMNSSIDKNDGAGSILKLNYDRNFGGPVLLYQNFQECDCWTIDYACEQLHIIPDMLCLDAQGSEIEILKGATKTLENIRYIITEVSYSLYYHDMPLYEDINSFMSKNNFTFVHNTGDYAFSEALYRNNKWPN